MPFPNSLHAVVSAAVTLLLARSCVQAEDLKDRVNQAGALFAKGDLTSAEKAFQTLVEIARRENNKRFVLIGLNGIGAVRSRQYRHTDAFQSLLEARGYALENGMKAEAGAVLANLASLYLQLDNLPAAADMARQSADITKGIPEIKYQAQMHLVMAMVRAREKKWDEAETLFREGLDLADGQGDERTLALALNNLGYTRMRAGRWREAERPLLEAFRWRLLSNDTDLFMSYFNLAELELFRGDRRLALTLANRGIALAQKQSVPLAQYRYLIARILAAQGDRRAAASEFERAIDESWRLRLDLLPADQFRIGAEFEISRLYEDAMENAASLADRGFGQDPLNRVWLAAAERRAYLLRASGLTAEQLRERLPSQYWELLARYRKLEGLNAANALPPSGGPELQHLSIQLSELESSAGIRVNSAGFHEKIEQIKTLTPFRRRLIGGSASISFHLGEARSHRWELTQGGVRWSTLPPRSVIDGLAKRFRAAVQQNRTEMKALGLELNRMLFGGMDTVTNRAGHWLLDLDGELFGAPLAAVTSTADGRERFLIEDRTLRVVPGAWSLLNNPGPASSNRMLVVADAIYNLADRRQGLQAAVPDVPVARRGPETGAESSELPSLPGSRIEADECVRIWGNVTVLTGEQVNRSRVEQELLAKPGVIHLATHVLQNPGSPDKALLALGLDRQGRMQFLSTADVAMLSAGGSLVVLSGCHSAAGMSLPGAGWVGMTRAWLLAGAESVIASQWPTLDDRGLLFQVFYSELREQSPWGKGSLSLSAAVALRNSQLRMLRSNTWRAHPNYWATYQLTAKTQ